VAAFFSYALYICLPFVGHAAQGEGGSLIGCGICETSALVHSPLDFRY